MSNLNGNGRKRRGLCLSFFLLYTLYSMLSSSFDVSHVFPVSDVSSTLPVVSAYPSRDFWDVCRECTSKKRVFCYTTGQCLKLHVDTPTSQIWGLCMNPLLIPDSCRSKGVHPPGTPEHREFQKQLEDEQVAYDHAGGKDWSDFLQPPEPIEEL